MPDAFQAWPVPLLAGAACPDAAFPFAVGGREGLARLRGYLWGHPEGPDGCAVPGPNAALNSFEETRCVRVCALQRVSWSGQLLGECGCHSTSSVGAAALATELGVTELGVASACGGLGALPSWGSGRW